jgi:tRNA(Ile)-lysidine synthase
MNVVNRVQQFLTSSTALNQRLIVAVSGGKDSMALLHICRQLNLNIIAAHCNFMLRDDASLLDESFVTEYCRNHDIPLETTRFATKEHRSEWKLSTQETARKLRYDWFEMLRNKHQAGYILTAHHANDVAETFFLNLLRGSGLKGLRSIPAINGSVLRPLLSTPVAEIEAYIAASNIPYRDDASNNTDAYRRNYIRHHVIPLLDEVNNQAIDHIIHTTALLNESYQLLNDQLTSLKAIYTVDSANAFTIDMEKLSAHAQKQFLLFEWLAPFGFNASTSNNIARQTPITGNKWLSDTHVALYSRGKLIVTPISENPISEIQLSKWPSLVCFGEHVYEVKALESVPQKFAPNALYFDKDLIAFPLKLRTWKHGDVFQPLGMKQEKKLSDFFIDTKINLNEKEKAMIIEAEKEIIAVAPYRISERYKVTAGTRNVIQLIKLG